MKRRKFLHFLKQISVSLLVSLGSLGGIYTLLTRNPHKQKWPEDPSVLRPPGALTERTFLGACIRCQSCKDSCPKNAIILATVKDNTYPGTPFINARRNACNLCLHCTTVCPTGALQPITKKSAVAMGTVQLDKRLCVSHNGSGICGACLTACPFKYKAIKINKHNAPEIFAEYCVGCGLCEEICIVKGKKAVRIFSGRTVL